MRREGKVGKQHTKGTYRRGVRWQGKDRWDDIESEIHKLYLARVRDGENTELTRDEWLKLVVTSEMKHSSSYREAPNADNKKVNASIASRTYSYKEPVKLSKAVNRREFQKDIWEESECL
jgi:hypothetical protein